MSCWAFRPGQNVWGLFRPDSTHAIIKACKNSGFRRILIPRLVLVPGSRVPDSRTRPEKIRDIPCPGFPDRNCHSQTSLILERGLKIQQFLLFLLIKKSESSKGISFIKEGPPNSLVRTNLCRSKSFRHASTKMNIHLLSIVWLP